MQSLLHYNTFGIDQSCNHIYEPSSVEALIKMLPEITKDPLLIIGGGSNLLLTKDFEGNVLHPAIKGIEVIECKDDTEHVLLRCGAGEVWDDVVSFAVNNNYYGMENMSLIPGEVGASAVQNVGAYGMEAKDVIYKIEAISLETGKEVSFKNEDCAYAYRYSKFKDEWKGKYVVTYVTYRLSRTFTPRLDYGNLRTVLVEKYANIVNAKNVRQAVIETRQGKLPDPKVEGNAGSFFMNPIVSQEKFKSLVALYPNIPYYVTDKGYKIPAGWMIEQCGWKGKVLGKAGVHSKQSLVIVNKGGAKGSDIIALCNAIRADVKERFDIDIHPEVNIV